MRVRPTRLIVLCSPLAADAGLGEKPVVVGHSFGGYMTMCYGHNYGDALSGAVIVDSFVRPPSGVDDGPREPQQV